MKSILSEALYNILLENRESKNINLARKFLKTKGYDDSNAQKILDSIRTDIPNSRLGQCKFLKGIARLFLNGELNDGETIQSLNKTLLYIASDAHINDYDNNLNDMSLNDLVNRFASTIRQDNELSRQNSYNKLYTRNNNYKIVRIPNFKTASQYGRYTSWCVTHDANMYNNYTNNGASLFYFCLKNGFENVPKKKGENCPLDEYGLSMIAISVDEDGEPNTITCRWNHDMEGNDHIMSKDELEDLLGVNFYEVFKPYTDDELFAKGIITRQKAIEMLASGVNPSKIFNKITTLESGFAKVKLNNKYSFINSDGNLIGNGKLWFDYAEIFYDGFAKVKLNNKYSFINSDGNLIGNGKLWFDFAENFNNGFATIKLNGKWSFIDKNGNLINDGESWFDFADNFYDGFATVELDNKWSFINSDGNLIGNGNLWFDNAYDFEDGFATVELDNKWSFINSDGNLIGNGKLWFDFADNFYDSFAKVELDNKWYRIDTKGNFYDYETGQPISSPIKRTNENIQYLKKIIKETITNYLNL